jgi:hypothetical protein
MNPNTNLIAATHTILVKGELNPMVIAEKYLNNKRVTDFERASLIRSASLDLVHYLEKKLSKDDLLLVDLLQDSKVLLNNQTSIIK